MWNKMQKSAFVIASNFVILPQIVIFSVFTIKFFRVTVLVRRAYLLLRSICGTGNSSQQTSLQHLSATNMVFSDKDKIATKSLYFEGVHSKEVDRRIS